MIQTRVNEQLDDLLKAEAARRRLPVSSLIRNVLEDALHLMGNVVDNVDAIAQDTIGLGRQASADASRLARRAKDRRRPKVSEAGSQPSPDFSDVYAWQSLTMNQPSRCALDDAEIGKGDEAYLALSDGDGPRRFLCVKCHARL